MTVHNKKLQHARQQGQKTGKQASGRGPVGKNAALKKKKINVMMHQDKRE